MTFINPLLLRPLWRTYSVVKKQDIDYSAPFGESTPLYNHRTLTTPPSLAQQIRGAHHDLGKSVRETDDLRCEEAEKCARFQETL